MTTALTGLSRLSVLWPSILRTTSMPSMTCMAGRGHVGRWQAAGRGHVGRWQAGAMWADAGGRQGPVWAGAAGRRWVGGS
jgi:hypothetical protein